LARFIDVPRGGVDQDEAVDQPRVCGGKVLCNEPPERDAADVGTRDPFAREHRGQLSGEVLDGVPAVWNARLSVAWKIIAEEGEAVLQACCGDVPQAVVDAETMEQDEKRT